MTPATAETEAAIESPLKRLSPEQLEQLAAELDAIHDRVRADLGDRDRRYIVGIVALQRRLAVLGRALLLAADRRPAGVVGTATLTIAKAVENMEIAHNVLHGQWDWMNDPQINSATWEMDGIVTAEGWKHAHNYVHHTFSNIVGKDNDLGYEVLRVDPAQKWYPPYLLQPLYNLLLMLFFEAAVAVHDIGSEPFIERTKSEAQRRREFALLMRKARGQIVKDYVAWPLVSGLLNAGVELALPSRGRRDGLAGSLRRACDKGLRAARANAKANATAAIVRNVWTYAIIFCGHFPDQTYTFSEAEVENETTGGWYVRQMAGAANFEGVDLFHVASGHLGFQIEHHLFPGLPSPRYREIAPEVQEICERYGLPYNSGPFVRQFAMVQRTILRLAFPGGEPRPKPGPYRRAESVSV
jgi:fatty acid desaturase